eukprot:g4823.t1
MLLSAWNDTFQFSSIEHSTFACVSVNPGDICPEGYSLMNLPQCAELAVFNENVYTIEYYDNPGASSYQGCVYVDGVMSFLSSDNAFTPSEAISCPGVPQSSSQCYCVKDTIAPPSIDDSIVYAYHIDLELDTELTGEELLAIDDFRESLERTIARVAECTVDQIVNIQLVRVPVSEGGNGRRRRLSTDDDASPDFDLFFDIYFTNYQEADAADARIDIAIDTYEQDDVFGFVNAFVEKLIEQLSQGAACTYDSATGNPPSYTWSQKLYIIDNVTFFPINHDLGSSVGEAVSGVLAEKGYKGSGNHDSFDVENHQGVFLALCPVANKTSGEKIIFNLADTEGVTHVDRTSGSSVSTDTHTIIYVTAGSVGVVILVALAASALYTYKVIHPRLKKNKKWLRAATARLEEQTKENKLMALGWQLKWEEIDLREKIGEGVAGEVWNGRLRGSLTVAVKTIKDSEGCKEKSSDDKEIAFMRRCRHPRLVLFLGYGRIKNKGDIFIVLEHMNKGGMDRFLWRRTEQEKAPTWTQRIRWLRDVAEGMIYLHEDLGCCHRDLKSPNVLLSTEKCDIRAKVSDFGVSKFIPIKNRGEDSARKLLEGSIGLSKSEAIDLVRSTNHASSSSSSSSKTSDQFNKMSDRSGVCETTSHPPTIGHRKSRYGGSIGNKLEGRQTRYGGNVSKDKLVDGTDLEGHRSLGGYWTSQVGTLEWLAPELLESQENLDESGQPLKATVYDQAVDQYSFGCVMYESLELRPPWSHERKYKFSVEIYDAVMEKLRPPVTMSAPKGFVDLMNLCWHQLPSQRPSFSDIAKSLEEIAQRERKSRRPTHTLSLNDAMTGADAGGGGNVQVKRAVSCPRPSFEAYGDVASKEGPRAHTGYGPGCDIELQGLGLPENHPPGL